MITLTNDSSGELLIANGAGPSVRLSREAATRLILHARMHNVADFLEALPQLIAATEIVNQLRTLFASLQTPSDRWNFKEKFARLQTLSKEHQPKSPPEVVETIKLGH